MKKMTRVIGLSLISAMLINGCGETTEETGDNNSEYKFENTVSSVKTNIIGTWEGDCIDTGDQFSKKTTKVFDEDNQYTSSISTFVGSTCSNYDSEISENGNYTIGALTSNEDIEISFVSNSSTLLTLVHFRNDKLYIANNINDTTAGVRETDFSNSKPLTKVK